MINIVLMDTGFRVFPHSIDLPRRFEKLSIKFLSRKRIRRPHEDFFQRTDPFTPPRRHDGDGAGGAGFVCYHRCGDDLIQIQGWRADLIGRRQLRRYHLIQQGSRNPGRRADRRRRGDRCRSLPCRGRSPA